MALITATQVKYSRYIPQLPNNIPDLCRSKTSQPLSWIKLSSRVRRKMVKTIPASFKVKNKVSSLPTAPLKHLKSSNLSLQIVNNNLVESHLRIMRMLSKKKWKVAIEPQNQEATSINQNKSIPIREFFAIVKKLNA